MIVIYINSLSKQHIAKKVLKGLLLHEKFPEILNYPIFPHV
jgi:hypothetical protein